MTRVLPTHGRWDTQHGLPDSAPALARDTHTLEISINLLRTGNYLPSRACSNNSNSGEVRNSSPEVLNDATNSSILFLLLISPFSRSCAIESDEDFDQQLILAVNLLPHVWRQDLLEPPVAHNRKSHVPVKYLSNQ